MDSKHIEFTTQAGQKISTADLSTIMPDKIVEHMSDPRVKEHMPLNAFEWNDDGVTEFIRAKMEYWIRDGLGHWAFLCDDDYAGWGGFQKEGNEWDFGLVLKPEYFGLGLPIVKAAITFANQEKRMPFITFLLPPSREHIKGILRLGANFVHEIEYNGVLFRKYRLKT